VSFVVTTRPLQGSTEQRGPLRIIRAAADWPGCPRNILLPERTTIVASALVDKEPGDVWALSDVATEYAARLLLERGVPQLTSLGDAYSLRLQNACAVVDDQTLRRVPALASAQRHERFGGWACSWGSDPYDDGFQLPAVDLFFQWVRPLGTSNGDQVQIGGRDVYIQRRAGANDLPACYARVVYHDRPLSDGQEAQEIVVLAVYAEVPESEQCQLARDIATTVASRPNVRSEQREHRTGMRPNRAGQRAHVKISSGGHHCSSSAAGGVARPEARVNRPGFARG
jgi:hypothetical protein